MKYNFDIELYTYRSIPYFLRQPIRINWLECLMKPIDTNIIAINDYRDKKLIELSYNGQTILLEKVLNDIFDPDLRRILILHNQPTYINLFFDSEGQTQEVWTYDDTETPLESDVTFLYYDAESPGSILPSNIDFRVVVPLELQQYENQISAVVWKYKIASKRFDIIFV